MLIFDGFKDRRYAYLFAGVVRRDYNLGTTVCNSQEESNEIDPFPFELTPPIVLVERTFDEREREITELVSGFTGACAGT